MYPSTPDSDPPEEREIQAKVHQLLDLLKQDQARLLARKRELEAQFSAAGLDTPEAIRAAYEQLDASERDAGISPASHPQADPSSAPSDVRMPRRFRQML